MKLFGMLLLAISLSSCERGKPKSLARAGGENGIAVKAEARSQSKVATIELERRAHDAGTNGVGAESFSERSLRLYVLDRSDSATFQLATGDEASGFSAHRLKFGPRGERVAYQLADRPWSVVYLLPPSLAVHAKATYQEAHWNQIPQFEDAFVSLYDAQQTDAADGVFAPHKSAAMVAWVKEQRSSTQLAPLLVELLSLDGVVDWPEHFEALEETGKARVRADLRKLVSTPDAKANHFEAAWTTGAFALDDEAYADVVRRGARVLGTDEGTLRGEANDAAAYLLALREQDVEEATMLACQITNAARPAHLALKDGRPLKVAIEEVVATNEVCK